MVYGGLLVSFVAVLHLRKRLAIVYSNRCVTLKRLVDMGVQQKIDYSDWAAPIVVVNKPNGKVRIYGDFKALNRCISVDHLKISLKRPLFPCRGGGSGGALKR